MAIANVNTDISNCDIARDLRLVETGNGTLAVDPDSSNDEESYTNPAFVQPSIINIDNSNDVIIGPVTHFNGPVTILQNHAALDSLSSQKTDSDNNQFHLQSNDIPPTNLKQRCCQNTGTIVLISLITIFVLTCSLIANYAIKPEVIDAIPEIVSGKPSNLGIHSVIYRNIWGGRKPLNFTRPLGHPVDYVIISHTAGAFCSTLSSCSQQVQLAQSLHVASGSPDIGYNFLIGGDANIYVGRGWDVTNFHSHNNSIGISFIGNYIFDQLSADMIDATNMLLKEGVTLGKLSKTYHLIAHNQTYPTQSPGANVYKVIKTWVHFLPGDYISWI